MVDLTGGLDGWSRPAAGHHWGWAAFAAGMRVCIEQGRGNLRRAGEAHDRVRRSKGVSDEAVRDSGLSPEEILGEPTWQSDLPFFMQRNFS